MKSIQLSPSDRTVFASCPTCNRGGNGATVANIYCMAYTKRQWLRVPLCENCSTPMQYKYEVKTDDE